MAHAHHGHFQSKVFDAPDRSTDPATLILHTMLMGLAASAAGCWRALAERRELSDRALFDLIVAAATLIFKELVLLLDARRVARTALLRCIREKPGTDPVPRFPINADRLMP